MATAFPEVKPWPKAPPATVAIGSNSAAVPMEVRVVDDFIEALDRDGITKRIKELAERGAAVTGCASADAAGRISDFVKMAGAATKAVEEEREKHNRPILTAGRALKGRADTLVADLNAAVKNARGHMDAFLAEELRKQRVEEQRIAAELRVNEADARAEQTRLQAIEDERAAKEKREAQVIEVEPEPVFTAPAVTRAPIRGNYGSAVSVTETWHVEVENIRQVPDIFLKHPSVIEALQKVIAPSVRGKNGLREVKGCRIFPSTGSTVR